MYLGKKWLYSGKRGCNRAEVVVFRRKWCYSGSVVVFRTKVVVFGQ